MFWVDHVSLRSYGLLLDKSLCDGPTNQFVTVSGDGQVLFWDVRYAEIAAGNLPKVGRRQGKQDDKPGKDGKPVAAPWLPLFRMQLKRLEGVGELSLCRVCLVLEPPHCLLIAPRREGHCS